MKTVVLNTGYAMPTPGFGVYRLSGEQEGVDAILSALEAGYRHLDTAAFYGNEKAVGKAVRQSGIPREEIFVTTKLWNDVQRTGIVAEAFEKSLELLDIGYIDLYLVHWPIEGKVTETWLAMEEIYRSGGVKSIGVSNHRIQDLEAILALGGTVPAVNQLECQPYFSQEEMRSYCEEKGIQMTAWGPLGSNRAPLLEEQVLKGIAAKHGKTTAQVVLRWNVQRGIVPLPKSQNPQRQRENLDIFGFVLDEGDMADIAKMEQNRRLGPDPSNVTF